MITIKKILSTSLFFLLLLASVNFILYKKSVYFGIVNLDDDELIVKNIDFISDLNNIPNFFITGCYFDKDTQYYRPVLNISFSIEAFLFKDNLKVYHFTNILLYIFALFIIFIFLSKLNFNKTILKFLILLFAVHPVLSSVPVWIPARNDTLLTIFFLLSLINFIDYIKTEKIIYLFFHFFFFFLSLFSKETTVLLICIYPLLIYCFDFKISKKQISYNLFFVIPLLVIYFILRHFAVQSVNVSEYFSNYSYYIKNIIFGIMLYIEKIIYPASMPIMLYDITPSLQTYAISVFVFLLLFYIFYKRLISKKVFAFAILFSFLAILPTFALQDYLFLSHRLIVSVTGILIILVYIVEFLITKYSKLKKYFVIIFIFLFSLFSFCSFLQIDKYKDSFTYWTNAYNDSPNYHIACSGFAKENIHTGNYDKAIELLFEAKKLKNIYIYDLDICTALISAGRISEAKNRLLRILNIKEDIIALIYLSEIYYVEGNIEKAVEFAKKAYKQDRKNQFVLNHIQRLPNFNYNI